MINRRMLTRLALLMLGFSLLILNFYGGEAQDIRVGPGGINFDAFGGPDPNTANFRSNDGLLIFSIVTHTAGNGFFNPVYVGATAAAQMLTAYGTPVIVLREGSPSPSDDPFTAIQIIEARMRDPKLDGIVITTPAVGSYGDIVRRAFELGIPIATTNSFDPTIPFRDQVSHTGQDAGASAIAGRALAQCLLDNNMTSGVVLLPNTIAGTNVEVNNRIKFAAGAIRESIANTPALSGIRVDDGPEGIGVDVSLETPTEDIINLIQATPNVIGLFGGNNITTPSIGDAVRTLGIADRTCAFGFDVGGAQQDFVSTGDLDGALGQQPFLQGLYPIIQIYMQIDRGVSAANLDTRAELLTPANLDVFRKFSETRLTNF